MSKTQEQTPELEKNMLVAWFEERFGYLKPYYKTIGVVAALLVLAVVLLLMIWQLNRSNVAQLWNGLSQAQTRTIFDQRTDFLADYADEMGDQTSSLWALQNAGDVDLRLGLFQLGTNREQAIKSIEKAKKSFQQVVDSNQSKSDLLQRRSVYSLAYALESLGEFNEAKTYYEQILEFAPESADAPLAKRGLARVTSDFVAAFYDDFKTREIGVAPGLKLPARPDISFPDMDESGTFGTGEADSGESTEGESTEGESTEGENENADESGENEEAGDSDDSDTENSDN